MLLRRLAGCFIELVKAAGINLDSARTGRNARARTRAPTGSINRGNQPTSPCAAHDIQGRSRKRLSGNRADRVNFADCYCERGRSYPEPHRLKMKNSRIPPESRIVSDQRSYPKKITLSPDVWGLDALHYLRFDPKSSKSFFPLSSRADFWSGGGAIRVTRGACLRSTLSDIESAARAQLGAFSGDCGHTMPFFAC